MLFDTATFLATTWKFLALGFDIMAVADLFHVVIFMDSSLLWRAITLITKIFAQGPGAQADFGHTNIRPHKMKYDADPF